MNRRLVVALAFTGVLGLGMLLGRETPRTGAAVGGQEDEVPAADEGALVEETVDEGHEGGWSGLSFGDGIQIPVQGYLTDDEGEPVHGQEILHLAIYEDMESEDPWFNEVQEVEVVDGWFSLELGTVQTLDPAEFLRHPDPALELRIGDGPALEPRSRLGWQARALAAVRAESADTLRGFEPGDFASAEPGEGLISEGGRRLAIDRDLLGEWFEAGSDSDAATRPPDESDPRSDMGAKADDNPLHHDRYTDAAARSAMGEKREDNPLHHDRLSPPEILSSLGDLADDNPRGHLKFTAADAVAAMGNKADNNPLNHERVTIAAVLAELEQRESASPGPQSTYSDADAVSAMGSKSSDNPLNHDRFSADEILSTLGEQGADNPRFHSRYSDAEAVSAMGSKSTDNPLNHDRFSADEILSTLGEQGADNPRFHSRYSDAEAVSAMGDASLGNPLNHQRFTAAEAVLAMGQRTPGNPVNHDRFTSAEALASLGPKSPDNPMHHDRYADADAVSAMSPKAAENPLNHDRFTAGEAVAAVNQDRVANACPAGMARMGLVCIDTSARQAANYASALATCETAVNGGLCSTNDIALCDYLSKTKADGSLADCTQVRSLTMNSWFWSSTVSFSRSGNDVTLSSSFKVQVYGAKAASPGTRELDVDTANITTVRPFLCCRPIR